MKETIARLKTIIQRYYVVRDHYLYTYDKQTQFKPSHVLYLEGCFVDPINHEDKNIKFPTFLSDVCCPTCEVFSIERCDQSYSVHRQ